mgnify:FL=1
MRIFRLYRAFNVGIPLFLEYYVRHKRLYIRLKGKMFRFCRILLRQYSASVCIVQAARHID